MIDPALAREKFAAGLLYNDYVATGTAAQQENWRRTALRVTLTPEHRRLLGSFTRAMPILVLSGTWCGDCVQQCPMIAAIAAASPRGSDGLPLIAPRFLDRDEHDDLASHVRICGGARVPTVIFLNEDFDFVSLLGDRTLSRYRSMAAQSLGPACPLPGSELPADDAAATLQDWVNETERVQLILRMSPKLRDRYND